MNIIFKRFIMLLVLLSPFYMQGCVTLNGKTNGNSFVDCSGLTWVHKASDLKYDDSVKYAELENGMRLAFMRNSEPEDRVAMYLFVGAGSLHEQDNQRGAAHFLEHMMFNGTKNFASGELTKYFQSIGMSFGGDTNAHTSYDETVYKIFLPTGDPGTLKKGVTVLRDFADGALLAEEEVAKERGVILAEKVSRETPGFKTREASSKFMFKGMLYPERKIIGVEETLKNMTSKDLKDYYQQWYRPENMALVIVGDYDVDKVIPLVSESFSSFGGDGWQTDCVDMGKLTPRNMEAMYFYDEFSGATRVSLETLWNQKDRRDSIASQKDNLLFRLINMIIARRLDLEVQKPAGPFTSAGYYSGNMMPGIGYAGYSSRTEPERWHETLLAIAKIQKQADSYGFLSQELKQAKSELLSQLEAAVLTADSRNSSHLASSLLYHIKRARVFQSPLQEQELVAVLLAGIDIEQLNEKYREVWSKSSKLLKVTGNIKLDYNAETIIIQAYKESEFEEVESYRVKDNKKFPYLLARNESPEVVYSHSHDQLGITDIKFGSGLVVHHKKTIFEPNVVSVRVDFGKGKNSSVIAGLSQYVTHVINGSGTATLKGVEVDSALADSSVGLRFSVDDESSVWFGSSLTKDFELLLQSLQAYFYDPAVRENSYQKSREKFEQMYARLSGDPHGMISLYAKRFLASGDKRFGMASKEHLLDLERLDIVNWYDNERNAGPLEITVVGDIEKDEVVELVGRYFSGGNRASVESKESEILFPMGEKLGLTMTGDVGKSAVMVAWPTDGFGDISRTRRLNILADIFEEKIFEVVREELGATYSPITYSYGSKVYERFGYIATYLIVESGMEEKVISKVLDIAQEFKDKGVTSTDLDSQLKPKGTMLKDLVKTNSYWLHSVAALSSRHPDKLVWASSILEDYLSIQAEELSGLAAKYLDKEKAAIIVIKEKNDI